MGVHLSMHLEEDRLKKTTRNEEKIINTTKFEL
jgi:hypothetical protein